MVKQSYSIVKGGLSLRKLNSLRLWLCDGNDTGRSSNPTAVKRLEQQQVDGLEVRLGKEWVMNVWSPFSRHLSLPQPRSHFPSPLLPFPPRPLLPFSTRPLLLQMNHYSPCFLLGHISHIGKIG